MKKICSSLLALAVCVSGFCFGGCSPKVAPVDEMPTEFFDAQNWQYMTVNGGRANVDGGIPYSLNDGSIKFHNANQGYDLGKSYIDDDMQFNIKTSKDWQIWLLSSSLDNNDGDCIKLFFKDEVLSVKTSESGNALATATAIDCGYITNAWNKMQISFSSSADGNITTKIAINDRTVAFTATEYGTNSVADGNVVVEQTDEFTLGNYFIVKVWEGDCILQLKPITATSVEPIKIACIGDSITYGANADNSYTDSYPAMLQKLYGGSANVLNLGNSGKTIRDTADDPYSKTSEYNALSSFVPDIAVIMLGTNDSKTYQVPKKNELIVAYKKLIDKLYDINSNMEIYIATCPYAYSSAYEINNKNIENVVNVAITEVADELGLSLIDMHEYTKGMSGCYADGIHPTSKGYSYLAYMFHCELEGIEPDSDYVQSFKNKK